MAQTKLRPMTGFSGTNDSRHLMPLSNKHLDLPKQMHTNALMLEYLLQPENTVSLLGKGGETDDSDAVCLLKAVVSMQPPVQVILDVGAQILELNNTQMAQTWLDLTLEDPTKQAAVFFDDNDEICDLDRKGLIEPLQTSPFATQLDVCVVSLDEAHTRGTDLKLPEYYRAEVTLGADLTKDRLVQGKNFPV